MSQRMYNNDNPLSRFSSIVFRRYIFKCLKVENALSPVEVIISGEFKVIKICIL